MSKKYTLETIQKLAASKKGTLISTEYINAHSKLVWQCEVGHIWKASLDSIVNANSWCPVCSGRAIPDISELQTFAINKGGLLISTGYVKAIQKVKWQCERLHQWEAAWNSVKNLGTWCPVCYSEDSKPKLSSMHERAKENNGVLLSTEFIDSYTKLLWECSNKHQWKAHWSDIKKGTWCPVCSAFKSESLCVTHAEGLYGIPFKKKRIRYSDHSYKFLEFDGYNEDYKIAIEYNGIQHYKFPNFWHKSEEEFNDQQNRDQLKREYCKINGIKLIEVPYTELNTLDDFLLDKAKENELNIVCSY
jgi:hypothetical protein